MTLETFIGLLNDNTNNLLGIGILCMLWFILFSALRIRSDIKVSILTASLSCALISIFMRYITLIDDNTLLIMWVIAIGSLVMLIIEE